MDVVLYYAPNACSLVPYVTLTEAGATFEVKKLNLGKNQQNSADYLKLNPKHKVPLLIVDGRRLSENVAIQVWIARNFPGAKLLPSDPWQELQAISILAWCASGIHPYLSRITSTPKVCDLPDAGPSVRKLAKNCCSRITRSPRTCWPVENTSSTISPRLTPISFGACVVAHSLTSTSLAFQIA